MSNKVKISELEALKANESTEGLYTVGAKEGGNVKVPLDRFAEKEAVKTELNKKARIESPSFSGTPNAPTPVKTSNNTRIATTAFVKTVVNDYATKDSPAFTGTPTAPTQPKSERNTRIATTGFAYDIAEEYGFRASEYGNNYRSIGIMGGNGTMDSPFTAIIGSDEWYGGLAAYNIHSGELAALDTDDNPLGEAFLKLDAMSWDVVYPEDDWNARTIACIIKNTAPAYSTLQIQVDTYDNLKTVVPLVEGMNYIEVLLEGHDEGTKLTARNTSLGDAPQFMGEAVPADEEPDEEDYFAWGTIPPKGRNCSFLAKTPGYYYHFGQTTLSEGETAIFYTVDFGSSWKKITLPAGGGETDTFDGDKTITGNLNVGGTLAVTGAVTAQSMTLGSSPVPESSDSSVPTTEWVRANYATTRATVLIDGLSLEKPLSFLVMSSGSIAFTVMQVCPSGHICKITFLCTSVANSVELKIKKKTTDAEETVTVEREDGYSGVWGFDVALYNIGFFRGYRIMALDHCRIY